MSRLLFQLTAFAATVFVMTILAMVAMLLGESEAPINVWFNNNGGTVLLIEVLAIVFLGMAAMFTDQRETTTARENSTSNDSTKP